MSKMIPISDLPELVKPNDETIVFATQKNIQKTTTLGEIVDYVVKEAQERLQTPKFIQEDVVLKKGMIVSFEGFGEVDGKPFRIDHTEGNEFKLVEVKSL